MEMASGADYEGDYFTRYPIFSNISLSFVFWVVGILRGVLCPMD